MLQFLTLRVTCVTDAHRTCSRGISARRARLPGPVNVSINPGFYSVTTCHQELIGYLGPCLL